MKVKSLHPKGSLKMLNIKIILKSFTKTNFLILSVVTIQLNLNENIETLKGRIFKSNEKDAEVKLYISPENITIRGIITDIEGDDYIIMPIKENPDEEIEEMKINKYDKY